MVTLGGPWVDEEAIVEAVDHQAGPEATLNVPLTLAPGATGPSPAADVLVEPVATEVHPLGTVMLNLTAVAGAPVVLVNVKVTRESFKGCVRLLITGRPGDLHHIGS